MLGVSMMESMSLTHNFFFLTSFVSTSPFVLGAQQQQQFTAVNLSVAISSIRENMGLILAALQVCGIGCLWILIAAIACINAYKKFSPWTLLYFVFSYYWTQQVLSNVVSVATAGNIGRWFVMGESVPDLNSGLRVSLICQSGPRGIVSLFSRDEIHSNSVYRHAHFSYLMVTNQIQSSEI